MGPSGVSIKPVCSKPLNNYYYRERSNNQYSINLLEQDVDLANERSMSLIVQWYLGKSR